MFGFNDKEMKVFRRLNKPRKIQDFVNEIRINFEEHGETCMSPRMVLKTRKAHCMEGAMFAAAALRVHGHKPLVMDLTASKKDDDHVVALFRQHGAWGAIAKTNHAVLRYREPVYKTVRELAMSFFHEYFTNDGKKTLRSYSEAVNLARFDYRGWMTAYEDVWYVPDHLLKVKHYEILNRKQIASLRRADPIEIKVGKVVEWKRR